MDTSDPGIEFDAAGVCNHCHAYDRAIAARVVTGPEAATRIGALAERIRAAGRGRDYDCILGVSGGVDSTFTAWKARELGLRPLALHLDNGWDSELAVKNIEQALKKLGIELYTHVIDWNEFRDLQLAFLRASTPDSEIPSDHAILAIMLEMARKTGVGYILRGFNARTESHLPKAWSQGHWDWKYVREIHRRFGRAPLTTFPRLPLWRLVWDNLRIRSIDLLNLTDYSKKQAMDVLERNLGWKYYGGKHHESIYTRFYQGYILPRKFGFDKRRSHLSSLICSGEIRRAEALDQLGTEPYSRDLQEQDRAYVIKKLGLTEAEFEEIMRAPPRKFEDFPSYSRGWIYRGCRFLYRSFISP